MAIQDKITIYERLKKSLINDMSFALCGCHCDDCEDCDCEKYELYSNILTKYGVYDAHFHSSASPEFALLSSQLEDTLLYEITCFLNDEDYIGTTDLKRLSLLIISLYYLTMYFIDVAASDGSDEALLEIQKEYDYTQVSECINKLNIHLCADTIPPAIPDPLPPDTVHRIWSYQFDDLSHPIEDSNTITLSWLDDNALLHTESSLIAGKNISQIEVGRIGFAIETTTANKFRILDLLGIDITETVFTHDFNAATSLETYISKSVYSNGSLYFKFKKL